MFQSQGFRKFLLSVAVGSILAVAGCQNEATKQAANPAPAPAKKAAAKPASKTPAATSGAKAAPAKTAAKPAAKKPQTTAAKGSQAKQVNASSKAPVAKTDASKPAAPTTLVMIPKGTAISATMSDALASNKNHAGDTFTAVLASSVKVNGKTVIPKGTHVTGRVVTVNKKTPELKVALASVDLNGKSYKLATEAIAPGGKSAAKSAGDSDPATSKEAKNITVAADRRLKFKLAKDVKLPVKS